MAVTQNQYTGNGNTVLFSFTFPYLAATDVKVKINGVTQATTEYSLANATTIQMNSAPANGATVLVFRDTDNDNKQATFYPGSAIKAEDLNNNIDQILYTAQEVDNNAMSTTGDDAMTGDLNLGGNKVTNMGAPTAGTDGVNKTHLDSTIDTAVESDVLVGTDLSKSASGGQVTISHNVTGANTTINNSAGNVVQDITISAQGHVTSAGSTNLDNRYYTENELDAGQLDNRYFTETELSGGQLNNLYYTETELDGGQLDNRYFTETELNNGALDNRYFTEAELNNGQLDTRYFRQDSSETITSGATWSGSDNYIATTAAIDARIVDLVDDVGGFVPIINETSFPATNPDINNGNGTLVSIKSISTERTPSGGSVVITDGAGSGNDVTITNLGTTVLPAGYGVIVQTTGTTHEYIFHRLSPDATSVTAVSAIPNEIATVAGISSHVQTVSGINNDVQVVSANNSNVTTVAGSITNVNTVGNNIAQVANFANVYRIVSSDPSTSLNAGDLIFNTTSNRFKVYNGSAWVDGVSSVGTFGDNTKLTFGDSNDLEIYHSSSNTRSYLKATTGDLFIETTVDDIDLISADDIRLKVQGGEYGIIINGNGSTDLYYDGSKKFETTSTGVYVDGSLGIGTTSALDKIEVQNGAVLVGHTTNATAVRTLLQGYGYKIGSNLYGNVSIRSSYNHNSNSGSLDFYTASGGTNTTERVKITSDGHLQVYGQIQIPNDLGKIALGASQDLEIYHNGAHSFIDEVGTGNLYIRNGTKNSIWCQTNGTVKLYYDDVAKFETTSSGVTISGNINLPDSSSSSTGRLLLGDNTDIQLYHDSTTSNNYLRANNGYLYLTANNLRVTNSAINESFIKADANGAVELYYDNVKKFETTSGGISVTGQITGTGHIDVPDYARLKLGNDDDLQIWHDGVASYIADTGTGVLKFLTDGFRVRNGGDTENIIKADQNGAVELYYDNVKKFETTSYGARLYGYQTITNPGGTAYLRIGDDATGNNYAHLDLVGDTTYPSYGFRLLRANTGANTSTNLYHRGSGWLAINAMDAGGGILFQTENASRWRIDADGTFRNANDTTRIKLGLSDDLQIYHDGSNSRIHEGGTGVLAISGSQVHIQNAGQSENCAKFIENGAVELYYDNVKKFETTAEGNTINSIGTSQDMLKFISNTGNAGERHLTIMSPAADNTSSPYTIATVNSLAFQVDSGVDFLIHTDGNLKIPNDTGRFYFGASDDLQIYHDGSHSRIVDSGTGHLIIQTSELDVMNAAGNEDMIKATQNGAVELYYDNSKKLETTSTGVSVTGNVTIPSGNGIDFSATADGGNGTGRSELLDDYEEGSWSFGLTGGSGSQNYATAARYTKIGRMVHLHWFDNVSRSNVGNSGDMNVNASYTSLPFTPISGTRTAYAFPHRNTNWAGEVDGKGLMFELYNTTLRLGILGDTNSYNTPIQENATIASASATAIPMSLSLTYYTND